MLLYTLETWITNLCDLLHQLLGHVLWEELDSKLELQRLLFSHVLRSDLLVQLQPSIVSFLVFILETKPPHFTKTNGLHNLKKT